MSRAKLCLLFSFVLLVSASTFAVDGVVLISQSTIVTGLPGCTDPNPGNFPIVICNPGSYRLSGNLTITGNYDAIRIVADNVTLDLNGFSITGPVVCDGQYFGGAPTTTTCTGKAGNGIYSSSQQVAVRNGVITGMYDGVILIGQNVLIEEIQAIHNSRNGITGPGGILRHNTASFNGNNGIETTYSTVSDNVVSGNLRIGIWANGPSSVTQNICMNNGYYGILATGSNVSGNTVEGNPIGIKSDLGMLGNNLLKGNPTPFSGSSVSQNNNVCDSGLC